MTSGPAASLLTRAPSGNPAAEFVAVVLGDTEDTWTQVFQSAGKTYQAPVLVLFEDAVRSACGNVSSATGPFYCPGDQKVYLDLSFFRELDRRFGVPGDFAQAYVVAHEVGHHVQNLLGTNRQVSQARQRGREWDANAWSVQMELQADCFAGIWGHHTGRKTAAQGGVALDPGDVEERLAVAATGTRDRRPE